MKIDKIMSPVASKLEFINDYMNILLKKYNNNNMKIAKYYEENDIPAIYNAGDLQKKPELAHLIFSQMEITHKINIGKALRNDIATLDHYSNSING